MSPSPPVSVVSTTFSPLRAYLSAAFNPYLQKYSGVVLFQFNTMQPAPPGPTHYNIEEGKEEAWGARSLRDINCAPEEVPWGRFREIHGQEGSVWPDVVHVLEYGDQLRQLTQPGTNMWRNT
ncbi:hypothetical protein BDP55DRAFT_149788 [Colletotrichum godetiae]|uniref:Uncharacterized protein n=1 Tax=Colletotrichum godetiae TaxID=1209918 RepID=A0AAJ0AQ45_9PEZI|nr:uncharacterized protein BDP55DRAFT_149788 [Colletotrichum godetiae]KAK1675766.1 hypothetical protein BDP55DRAFT_149788 [Colletotrichum godetiae]